MQRALFFLACLALPVAATSVTPVQKVVEMLTGMVKKAKKEKHEEQVQFAAYEGWCTGIKSEKDTAIADATSAIEMLEADIGTYNADIARLTEEIGELDANIQKWNSELQEAIKVRDLEKVDYMKTHQDYQESVDALNMAINVLKQQAYGKAAAALMQVKSLNRVPDASKRVIDAFLAQAPADPEAPVYEFASGDIIAMLEKLKDKFKDEKTVLESEEVAKVAAHDMLVQNLSGQTN